MSSAASIPLVAVPNAPGAAAISPTSLSGGTINWPLDDLTPVATSWQLVEGPAGSAISLSGLLTLPPLSRGNYSLIASSRLGNVATQSLFLLVADSSTAPVPAGPPLNLTFPVDLPSNASFSSSFPARVRPPPSFNTPSAASPPTPQPAPSSHRPHSRRASRAAPASSPVLVPTPPSPFHFF